MSQITTFYLNNDLYGLDVLDVQEVTGHLKTTPTPLAPNFVSGLINLRGQIATAINLKSLLNLPIHNQTETMSVVCRIDGNLVSFQVDSIGEVLNVENYAFEPPTETLPSSARRMLKGIYKVDNTLLCFLDIEKLSKELFNNFENNDLKNNIAI